jgi:hypothetical protein
MGAGRRNKPATNRLENECDTTRSFHVFTEGFGGQGSQRRGLHTCQCIKAHVHKCTPHTCVTHVTPPSPGCKCERQGPAGPDP